MTTLCLLIAVMAVMVAMNNIRFRPHCPFCGKTREHANDCPTQKE